ncbi:type 4 pilus major pilin [Telmatospirillum siberiense]|nr:type 4 pilus major pilin [Telmatospirillum siberiense]
MMIESQTQFRRWRKQRGLFGGAGEQQMVLASAAVIVATVVAIAYGMLGRSKAEAEFQLVDGLVNSFRDVYAGEAYGTAAAMITAITHANRLGAAKVLTTTTLSNNYSGSITPTSSGTSFQLTDTNIPYADCITILRHVPTSGYTSVQVGSTTLTPPVTLDDATNSCASGAVNTIIFTAQ